MRVSVVVFFVLTSISLLGALSCAGGERSLLENIEFPMIGFSMGPATVFPDQIKGEDMYAKALSYASLMNALGAKWIRAAVPWSRLEEEVSPDQLPETLEEAGYLVDDFVERVSSQMKDFEDVFRAFSQKGINVIAAVAVGYSHELPRLPDSSKRLTPDAAGRERYLAGIYTYTRAVVRVLKRYVKVWQIENELNVACETVVWGWRHGGLWCRWDFLDELMETIYTAVKEEDPESIITHNFHTDIHWVKDVKRWYHFVDIVGLDAYPNYLQGFNPLGEEVSERVSLAVRIFGDHKPVVVLESGYPTEPAQKGFSEEGQAEYIKEAMKGAFLAGASGFLYFTLVTSQEGGYGIQSVEPYWGLIRKDGTFKEGWYAYAQIVPEVKFIYETFNGAW